VGWLRKASKAGTARIASSNRGNRADEPEGGVTNLRTIQFNIALALMAVETPIAQPDPVFIVVMVCLHKQTRSDEK